VYRYEKKSLAKDLKNARQLLKAFDAGRLRGKKAVALHKAVQEALFPWYVPMLNDVERNQFYFKVLKSNVPNKTVFEIGTGVGLLAIMAARLGAKHVYTCEMNPLLYELARKNILKSGVADRITLIYGNSKKLKLKKHIPEKVDFIVSENIANDILSERMISTLKDSKRFLKSGGRFLPEQVTASIQMIELKVQPPWRTTEELEFTKDLNRLVDFKIQFIFLTKDNHRRLSKVKDLFKIERGCIVEPSFPIFQKVKAEKRFASIKDKYLCLHFEIKDGSHSYTSYDPKALDDSSKHWIQAVWHLGDKAAYNLVFHEDDESIYLERS